MMTTTKKAKKKDVLSIALSNCIIVVAFVFVFDVLCILDKDMLYFMCRILR